jgi:hypothetical protein
MNQPSMIQSTSKQVRRASRSWRAALGFAALTIALAATAIPAQAQSCTDSWTGAGDGVSWSLGLNWSDGSEPVTSDNVCIQTSGAAVNMNVSDTIANLTVGSGASLTLPNGVEVNNSLLIDGSFVTNAGQIILPGGNGQVLLFSSGGNVTLSGGGTVTLNTNSAITGFGAGATLVNQETIQGAGAIEDGIPLTNTSTGVIDANQAGTQLTVGRNGTTTNTGLMEATNGGQLVMGSLTLQNAGGIVQAVGTNSSVLLEGEGAGNETFSGGTWRTSGGGIIYSYDTTVLFDGTTNPVTNAGTLQLIDGASHPGGNFQGTVKNTKTIQILSKGDEIVANIPGGQTWTLTGSGSMTLGDGTDNAYNNQVGISGGTFVNQQLLQGSGFIENLTSFSNSGTINANVATGPNNLQLQLGRAGASTNTGIIEATNGGALVIDSTSITNTGGTIEAVGANSYVSLAGSLTISGGTYTTSGGGIIYGQGGTTLDGTTNAVTNSGTFIVNAVGNPPNINAGGTLNNTGTIELLPSAGNGDSLFLQLVGGENLTLAGSGKLIMGDGTNNSYNNQPVIGDDFGGGGIFTNQSTIEGSGIIGSGILGLVNSGTINVNVPAGTAGVILSVCCEGTSGLVNSGTMEASNGGTLEISPYNSFNNTGTLNAAANSTINVNNTFLNLVSGTLTGGTYSVTGILTIPGNITTNDAKITLTGTASQILNPNTTALAGFVTNGALGSFSLAGGQSFTAAGTFTNSGVVTIAKGSIFTVGAGGMYVQNSGKTTVNGELTLSSADGSVNDSESGPDAGTAVIRIARGSLLGNGGNIAASVSSSGTVVPGSITTAGKLAVTGAYSQSSTGALNANLTGTSAGEFSLLHVTGAATLSGTLNIELLNSFVPAIGDTFEILTAGKVSGTFGTVNGTVINGSEQFTVTYNSNNVTLTVVPSP